MPRVKNSVATRRRRKKILKLAKGAHGSRSKLFKNAKETVKRGMNYAYRDRRVRKREFRALWIARISAGVRAHGMKYSEFMHGMKLAGIELDRKVLADLAMNDAEAFGAIVSQVRNSLAQAA
ncbi:MAG TPA: 50S ribosomal protein L20 [Candidatus Sumerlaeota bacterium]|nr:50S ribosomal protein L20 [Candidatus Sumerlaeota bacterium]